MESCFVIQPFNEIYDKRYIDIYKPAIKASNLEPYRVDKDPSTRIPITSIEEGILNSVICFADITEDNPNVWYELGYAFAAGKDVVMICSKDRKEKFPFDIQHRSIIRYDTSSSSDFELLKTEITQKLTALLSKEEKVKKISESVIKQTEGLSNHEISLLAIIMEEQAVPDSDVSIFGLRNDMERAGYNKLATSIALRELDQKKMIELYNAHSSYNYEEYPACRLTDEGVNWLLKNQEKFEFKISKTNSNIDIEDDDLPF